MSSKKQRKRRLENKTKDGLGIKLKMASQIMPSKKKTKTTKK